MATMSPWCDAGSRSMAEGRGPKTATRKPRKPARKVGAEPRHAQPEAGPEFVGYAERAPYPEPSRMWLAANDFRAEYLTLLRIVDGRDRVRLLIKTGAMLLLGGGIAAAMLAQSVVLVAFVILAALCLSAIDRDWASRSHAYRRRAHDLEVLSREPEMFNLKPLYEQLQGHPRDWEDWITHTLQLLWSFPYALMILVAVGAYASMPTGDDTRAPAAPSSQLQESLGAPSTKVSPQGATTPVANTASRPGDIEPADKAAGNWRSVVASVLAWWPLLIGGIAIWVGIWLRGELRERSFYARNVHADWGRDNLEHISTASSRVGVIAALTAAGTAWVAIGSVDGAWKLTLPLLISPGAAVLAANSEWTSRYKWRAFAAALLISSGIAVAHLIDRQVAGDAAQWWPSLAGNLVKIAEHLSFGDIGTLFAALLAYIVALMGAAGAGAKQ